MQDIMNDIQNMQNFTGKNFVVPVSRSEVSFNLTEGGNDQVLETQDNDGAKDLMNMAINIQ